jgi:anaerobic dimethyl sulfoxide reductase subunit B (iron-sulfur subunit)
MNTYGLLIDYEYCTHCGSCEVSCKEEHGFPVGQCGIKVLGDGPWKIDEDNWNWNWYPVLTDLCDLCASRTARGREPICVHHCLANIITYGTVEELAKKLEEKPKQFLIVPQYKPREARGKFVHKDSGKERKAAHIEVDGTGKTEFGAHRSDSRVGELEVDVK